MLPPHAHPAAGLHAPLFAAGTVWLGDLATASWSRATPASPSPSRRLPQMRVSPAVVVLGHHLWVYGGVDLVAQEYLSDVWLLDLQV